MSFKRIIALLLLATCIAKTFGAESHFLIKLRDAVSHQDVAGLSKLLTNASDSDFALAFDPVKAKIAEKDWQAYDDMLPQAVKKMGSKGVPRVAHAISGPVRLLAAINSLAEIGPSTLPFVEAELPQSKDRGRWHLLFALREIGRSSKDRNALRRVCKDYIEMFAHGSSEDALVAAIFTEGFPASSTYDLFVSAASSPSAKVRLNAVRVMGKQKAPEYLKTLLTVLGNRPIPEKRAAAYALGVTRTPNEMRPVVSDVLLSSLSATDPKLIAAVLDAGSRQRCPWVTNKCKALSRSKDPVIRNTARQILLSPSEWTNRNW